ncbi:MAG TPA: endo alpha-1,4 polygalactosaminidase, partial [Solirubrobacterales bacterium]|nr:endo alpha-1,4 polygalactosaminidase [Solirubrobacterales bacterium]
MSRRNLATWLTAAACLTALLLAPTAAARWHPKPTTAAWQWQLQGKIDLSVEAAVYEVDGFEAPAKAIAALHRKGRRAICYLDVGSWESYRPDAGRFPKSVLGRAYEGYPD